jgi:hypothetical protein
MLTEIAPPYYYFYDTVTRKEHGKNRTRGREFNKGDFSLLEKKPNQEF